MEQKVLQVGNSLAVTLPAGFVRERKIRPGQNVFVDLDLDYDMVRVATSKKTVSSVTPEFKDWLDKFNKKYKKALTELAGK
jgi:antitoxin component of MazEF toxin-antitoxin module